MHNKIRILISFLLVGGFLLTVIPVQAQRVEGKRSVLKSSKRFEKKNTVDARVTSKSKSNLHLYHGIIGTFNVLYYSGDVLTTGEMIKYGAITENFSAGLTLNYKLTFNKYVSMRFGVQFGFLRADNLKLNNKGVKPLHKMNSFFAEPVVGVEVYPIVNYGFFLFGCVGLAGSIINYTHQRTINTKLYQKQRALGIVPMGQFGLGYNWWITKDLTLGVELLGQIAFFDGVRFGLDGWPNKEAFGTGDPSTWPTDIQKSYKNSKDPDGILQLGFVVAYHFN